MPPRTAVSDIIDTLDTALAAETAPDRALIERCLAHKSSYVCAKAAGCISKFPRNDYTPLLCNAFARFCENGARTDKGCVAKKAITKSLDRLAFDSFAWFDTAAACVQMEPVYGGTSDTAVEVRCAATRAMVRFAWRTCARALVRLSGDCEARVRIAALEVIAAFSGPEPQLVLMTKAMAGDTLDEVTGACLHALLEQDLNDNYAVVAGFITHRVQGVRLEAALAIGESRAPGAFEALRDVFDTAMSVEEQRGLLLAISMLRSDQARTFICERAADRRFAGVVAGILERWTVNTETPPAE